MNGSDVGDILVFLSVVESGSFVAGGRALGLSRSAAGKAVARLEARFGARLLNRTTRALDLTSAGQTLYDDGLTVRAALEATLTRASAGPGAARGTLRLTVPDAFGRRVVLPVVRRYLTEWPEVHVEMSFSDRIANLVEDGFDLAIRIGVTSPDKSLVARTVLVDEPVLCAAPAYLANHGRPSHVHHLARHDLLFFASRGERQGIRLRDPGGAWVRAQGKSRLRVDSGEALRDAAVAGMGIAFLPRFLVGDDLTAGALERVLPEVDGGKVKIVALYPHKRLLEPRVRRFIDLLVAALAPKKGMPRTEPQPKRAPKRR